jgi:hypothetical protein
MKPEAALDAHGRASRVFRGRVARQNATPFPANVRCRSVDSNSPASVSHLLRSPCFGDYRISFRIPKEARGLSEVYMDSVGYRIAFR